MAGLYPGQYVIFRSSNPGAHCLVLTLIIKLLEWVSSEKKHYECIPPNPRSGATSYGIKVYEETQLCGIYGVPPSFTTQPGARVTQSVFKLTQNGEIGSVNLTYLIYDLEVITIQTVAPVRSETQMCCSSLIDSSKMNGNGPS